MNLTQHSTDVALVVCAVILTLAVVLGRNLSVKIGSIHAELKPNGGKSTRDAIDNIGVAMKDVHRDLKDVHHRLDRLEQNTIVAPIAPVAPVLPVAPVAPVLPVLPIAPIPPIEPQHEVTP